jgi:sortase A
MVLSQKVEYPLIGFGAALVTAFLLLQVYSETGALVGRMSFDAAAPAPAMPTATTVRSGIDFTLWSEKRIRAFQESLAKHFQPPVALLNIPRIHLNVPVFNGTDERGLPEKTRRPS